MKGSSSQGGKARIKLESLHRLLALTNQLISMIWLLCSNTATQRSPPLVIVKRNERVGFQTTGLGGRSFTSDKDLFKSLQSSTSELVQIESTVKRRMEAENIAGEEERSHQRVKLDAANNEMGETKSAKTLGSKVASDDRRKPNDGDQLEPLEGEAVTAQGSEMDLNPPHESECKTTETKEPIRDEKPVFQEPSTNQKESGGSISTDCLPKPMDSNEPSATIGGLGAANERGNDSDSDSSIDLSGMIVDGGPDEEDEV